MKIEKIVALENSKLKLLKLLSSNNNALCNSSKGFFQHLTLETWSLRVFSAKMDQFQYAPGFYAHSMLIRHGEERAGCFA